MRIKRSVTVFTSVLFATVLLLVTANVIGYELSQKVKMQAQTTRAIDTAVLDLNVLAAEMQLSYNKRAATQFESRIQGLRRLLSETNINISDFGQVLLRMRRSVDRLEVAFQHLVALQIAEEPVTSNSYTARRTLTLSFLAATTTLAALSERLSSYNAKRLEEIERNLVALNVGTGVAVIIMLGLAYGLFMRNVLKPVLELGKRIEKLAVVSDGGETEKWSGNEIENLSREFDRRYESLKRAEKDKEEYAHELERSNRELEQFAYVASHDLKAPLKGIKIAASWIREDAADKLDADSLENLDLVEGRAERLDRLLDSLLQYSRVATMTFAPEMVNVNHMIEDISTLLDGQKPIKIEVPNELPIFKSEHAPLQQVLQNLIDNAIKHHDRDTGCIQVLSRDAGKFYEFEVRDDGPGIDPKYHDKVQQIFQTLKRRDEMEASGMGLAIVKKSVERRGGTFRIESTLNERGCAMIFTWPKKGTIHA